jgi:hypothetical protein
VSEPCELPRDSEGRPRAREDQVLRCGHLLSPICKPDELCTSKVIAGLTPRWTHSPKVDYATPIYCYALPSACLDDRSCECVEGEINGKLRCPRGYYLACAPGDERHHDFSIDCEGIR